MFRFMVLHDSVLLLHGLVFYDFGKGVVIPLLKDKLGCINSLENYRGITLTPVLAKLFELSILEVCSDFLITR